MEHACEKEMQLSKQIASLNLGEKIRLALTGNKEARVILYRDSQKVLGKYVLQNPRIGDDEVLSIARDRNTSEDILTALNHRKDWIKKYPLRLALTINPKTPVPLALKMLKTLRDADLRKLVKSKDIPTYVASGARRLLESKGLL